MSIGVEKYNFINEETANRLIPANTTIDKKRTKIMIEKIAKRILDIAGGLVGILILIPLTAIIYIANLIYGDKGPVFFVQKRIGKDGKLFKMYKFRSMVVGADEKLIEYLAKNEEARKEYSEYKKLKNDPRVTKIGNFIRRTSIDEFPQFINVLKGDMSLVGPRPYLPREQEEMGIYYNSIIKCKPGLTGFWQISGRSDVNFDNRLNMDYAYNQYKGFKLDVKLLVKTVVNVIKKEGAI